MSQMGAHEPYRAGRGAPWADAEVQTPCGLRVREHAGDQRLGKEGRLRGQVSLSQDLSCPHGPLWSVDGLSMGPSWGEGTGPWI